MEGIHFFGELFYSAYHSLFRAICACFCYQFFGLESFWNTGGNGYSFNVGRGLVLESC
jgi:hypothetical protein